MCRRGRGGARLEGGGRVDRPAGGLAHVVPRRRGSPRGALMRLLESPDQIAPLPPVGPGLIDAIQRSGLAGRGGAGFPTAVKWRAVAQRSRGDAVIVVNGAEGEPQSKKDRVLMGARPHLVLDGAFLAARGLRARRIVLCIGERHTAARDSILRALAQRTEPERGLVSMAAAPPRYVAGAEAAAVHLINDGVAIPTNVPPYPFERGVDGAPTLVQNVETLAHVAVLARTGAIPGTMLLTLAGGVSRAGVVEVETGATVADLGRLQRWGAEVRGRGACKHPDGATIFLSSALTAFPGDFEHHQPHDVRRTA